MIVTILAQIDGWHHHGWGGGWMWLWGSLMMLGWVAVIAAVIAAIVLLARRAPSKPDEHISRARQILSERYARGELSSDEYHERLQALR